MQEHQPQLSKAIRLNSTGESPLEECSMPRAISDLAIGVFDIIIYSVTDRHELHSPR